jgi:PAS domain S-box-containing protein
MSDNPQDRVPSESQIRESEDRLRFAMRSVAMLAYEWNATTFELSATESLSNWLGFHDQFPIPTLIAFTDLLHPDDRERLKAAVRTILSGSEACETEFRVPLPDGTETVVICRSQRMQDRNGEPTNRVAGVMQNVTERRNSDQRLRMLESAVVHARDAIIILEGTPQPGLGRSVLYANSAFFEMSGYEQNEVIGRSLHLLRGPKSDPATLEQLRDALNAGVAYKGELLNYRKNGEPYWVELSLVPVPDATHAGRQSHWVMIQRDISDRKSAEQQLFQAQKMDLIGQMAGGIAHDFNNLLTGIIGNLSLAELPADDPAKKSLETALKAAHRAADLTRKLLGFARKNQLIAVPVPIDEIVQEVIVMVSRTFGPRIHVRSDVVALDRVTVDPTLISQVLLNLCLNARDAMPNGGEIVLSVRTVDFAEPTGHPESRTGKFIRVTVQDNGEGMPPEVREKIFEPFFTTKPVGQGTGLGLAMVHGIMTQHKGWVECESTPGQGTRFDLYLPRISDSQLRKSGAIAWPTERKVPDASDLSRNKSATILIVDDESMIRELLRTVLEAAGYKILECEDGEQAVAIFHKRFAEIDLVILDLTMPKLTGQETFRLMHGIDPTARVLLSSGYSHDDIAGLDGILGMLPKPYRPAELLKTVAQVLAMPRPAPEAAE